MLDFSQVSITASSKLDVNPALDQPGIQSGLEIPKLAIHVDAHTRRRHVPRVQNQDSPLAFRRTHKQCFRIRPVSESGAGDFKAVRKNMGYAGLGMRIAFKSGRDEDRAV